MMSRHKRWPHFFSFEVDAFTVLGVWWLPSIPITASIGMGSSVLLLSLAFQRPRSKATCNVRNLQSQSSTT